MPEDNTPTPLSNGENPPYVNQDYPTPKKAGYWRPYQVQELLAKIANLPPDTEITTNREGWLRFFSNDEGNWGGELLQIKIPRSQRCTGHSRQRPGKRCKNRSIAPTTKCKDHGGKTLRGANHPSFKTGAHSAYLPAHLLQDYLRGIHDPDLASQRSQLALLQTRELELTRKLNDLKPPPWGSAISALSDFESTLKPSADPTQRKKDQKRALQQLRKILRTGADAVDGYNQTWQEIRELCLEKAKIAQVELKLAEMKRQHVPVEQVAGLLMNLLLFIRDAVPDRNVRQAIQDKVNSLMDGYNGGRSAKMIEAAVIQDIQQEQRNKS